MKLGEVFVEPTTTLAAVDRLMHHATISETHVQSYRRRAAPPHREMRRPGERLAQHNKPFNSSSASTGQNS